MLSMRIIRKVVEFNLNNYQLTRLILILLKKEICMWNPILVYINPLLYREKNTQLSATSEGRIVDRQIVYFLVQSCGLLHICVSIHISLSTYIVDQYICTCIFCISFASSWRKLIFMNFCLDLHVRTFKMMINVKKMVYKKCPDKCARMCVYEC